jgi:hypothetical protein
VPSAQKTGSSRFRFSCALACPTLLTCKTHGFFPEGLCLELEVGPKFLQLLVAFSYQFWAKWSASYMDSLMLEKFAAVWHGSICSTHFSDVVRCGNGWACVLCSSKLKASKDGPKMDAPNSQRMFKLLFNKHFATQLGIYHRFQIHNFCRMQWIDRNMYRTPLY